MSRSIRKSLRTLFPKLHKMYVRGRHKVTMEYKVVRQIGLTSILRGDLWRRSEWRNTLPMQKPQRIEIQDLAFSSIEQLTSQLDAAGLPHADGGNAVYLPPAAIDGSAFRTIRNYYPPDAGLKIVRCPGDVKNSQYIGNDNRSAINRKLTGSHGHMSMAANLLYHHDLGPRLYDLVELDIGGQIWTAYAVQHVDGRTPTMAECRSGIQRLQALERTGVARVTLPSGYEHKDFTCPECNNNALITTDGAFHYVDFQNFVLASYQKHLQQLADAAGEDANFSPNSAWWGGRLLNRSIPDLCVPWRHRRNQRFAVIHRLLNECGVSLQGKLVLDVQCNIGMAMAEYMQRGAKWCHGWEKPKIAGHAEEILPALGCTRFSLTRGKLEKTHHLEDDVGSFVQSDINGCVISYLAVNPQVGWLDSLSRILWSYLIYAGHQSVDFESDMQDLAKIVDFEILQAARYSAGPSGDRTVAILKRKICPNE